MQAQTFSGVSVRGICTAVPTTVSRTADYELLPAPERERFRAGTGIAERRIVSGEQCASDLCAHAADDLLARLGWDKASVGALVLITQTGDHVVPATSILLQHRLGLPTHCIAFDVNLGCSSFPYGLAIVGSLMKTLSIGRALLLIGDVSSKVCAYTDKSAWPLFGDAGSATALELDPSAGAMHFDLMNDGAGKEAIIIRTGGLAAREPLTAASLVPRAVGEGIERSRVNLELRGADIFSFAISKAPASIARAFEASGLTKDSVDYLVLHQANKMINDTVIRKSGVAKEKALSSLERFGNTSSVSIPLTICANRESLKLPCRVAACGFGVGLSWGTSTFELAAGAKFGWLETDAVYKS